jgi:3-hydroxypropanoate dehydrogenase
MSAAPRILDDRALDILFREARTHRQWQDREVSDVLLQALFDLLKWGPTEANCCPMRVKFIKSPDAKEKLKPCLSAGNVDKTMTAPATAVIAMDLDFYEHMARLNPDAKNPRSWYEGKPETIKKVAARSTALEGAYLIMAARALGLDCGPMSGFDADKVKDAFFPGRNVEVYFLCNLGYGDPAGLKPRGPRFDFDDVCEIL